MFNVGIQERGTDFDVTIANHCMPPRNTLQIKVQFYLWNSVTFKDVESQRKGVVVISLDNSLSWRHFDFNKLFTKGTKALTTHFFASIPTRIVAVHHCMPDNPITQIMKLALATKITTKSQRVRFLFHMHQDQESGDCAALYTRYKLKGYGIPIELLPITESGVITTKVHAIFIKTRKLFEEGQFEEGSDGLGQGVFRLQFSGRSYPHLIVDCPCSSDVLFRQGKTMMEHQGNVMFRDLILDYLEREDAWRFNRSSGFDFSNEQITYGKQQFLNSWILREIFDRRRGRFLEWDREKSVWVLMTDLVTIKRKISVVYTKYRKLKARPNHTLATTTDTPEQVQPIGAGSSTTAAYQFLNDPMTSIPGSSFGGFCGNNNRSDYGNQNFMDSTNTPNLGYTALDATYNGIASEEATRKRPRNH